MVRVNNCQRYNFSTGSLLLCSHKPTKVERFCHLDCHFLSIDASCDGCHAGGRQRLLNPEHLVLLSAGPISHNSIHLLIITTDFVSLY